MTQRFNIYDFPHKALRNFLGQLNLQFGNTNYQNQEELKSLKTNFLKLMSLLASHSHIEDQQIIMPLEKKGVNSFENDKKEHHKLDDLVFNISRAILSLNSNTEDAQEKGRILYLFFNQFQGTYLLHMHREETESLPVVLENMTDEELFSIRDYIIEKTPPKILLNWYWYALPAQTHQERVMGLKPIVAKNNSEILQATLEVVKKVLSEQEFKAVVQDLGLKIV